MKGKLSAIFHWRHGTACIIIPHSHPLLLRKPEPARVPRTWCRTPRKGREMSEIQREQAHNPGVGGAFRLAGGGRASTPFSWSSRTGVCCAGTSARSAYSATGRRRSSSAHFSRFFSPEDIRNGQPEHELPAASAEGRADSVRWQPCAKTAHSSGAGRPLPPSWTRTNNCGGFARVMHDLTDSQQQEAEKKRADGLAEAKPEQGRIPGPVVSRAVQPAVADPQRPEHSAADEDRRPNYPAGRQHHRPPGGTDGECLVDDLLDVSRITKGKLRPQRSSRWSCAALRTAPPETARPFIDARKHEFSLLLLTEPIWVEADPQPGWSRSPTNLLNNAAKYTDSGGFIRMTVGREGAEAVVRVRDSGVGGIPPLRCSPASSTCSPRWKAHSASSRGGLGIGLTLVRTLVEMHGGRVQPHSAGLGKGSEFTVKPTAMPPRHHGMCHDRPCSRRRRRRERPC